MPKAPAKTRKPRAPRKLRASTPEAPRLPIFDSKRGRVNIWPIVYASADELVSEIEAGAHDDYLTDLAHADKARHDGGGRPQVQAAITKRRGG